MLNMCAYPIYVEPKPIKISEESPHWRGIKPFTVYELNSSDFSIANSGTALNYREAQVELVNVPVELLIAKNTLIQILDLKYFTTYTRSYFGSQVKILSGKYSGKTFHVNADKMFDLLEKK